MDSDQTKHGLVTRGVRGLSGMNLGQIGIDRVLLESSSEDSRTWRMIQTKRSTGPCLGGEMVLWC